MPSDILVSIVIPTHDRWGSLASLLETIPDRADLEVVVVDDHSSTPCPDYRATWKKTRLTTIEMPDDLRYAGNARNAGIAASAGAFVFFADSDDLIEPDGFTRLMDALPTFESDILYGRISSFIDGTDQLGRRHQAREWLLARFAETGNDDFLCRMHVPYGQFIARAFLDRHAIRFGPTRVSNDVLFNADLILAAPGAQVRDDIVYRVREGNASLTSTPSLAALRMRLKVLGDYNRRMRAAGRRHLRVCAAPYLVRAFRISPLDGVRIIAETARAGHPIVPPRWTILNAIHRRLSGPGDRAGPLASDVPPQFPNRAADEGC